jgi:hypothetical protein
VLATATPEQELALRLAATGARRAAAKRVIGALAARADYGALDRLLRRQGLLAVIGARLEELAPGALPPAFLAGVQAEIDRNRRWGMAQRALTVRWASRLEAAGIACLPLKGCVLRERIYGDLGLRRSADVDLLVGPVQLEAAVAVLRQDGFAAPADRPSQNGLPLLHFELRDPRGRLPPVELHWRIHWYEERFSAALLQRSDTGPAGFRIARPEDELAALLLFFARDAFVGLRLACDVAAWWDAFGAGLASLALQPIVDAHPGLRPALATSASLAAAMVGLPAERLLDLRPARARRARAAARLVNWELAGTAGQSLTNYYLADLLLSPPGGARAALRRQLFRAPGPQRGLRRVVDRLRRVVVRPPTRLARSAAGLWRIRGGRSFSPLAPRPGA